MKLSNLAVVFIVIAIPLVLILSYYISLQRDTINLQLSYDAKLLESTKDAIKAFEINTVEWDPEYSTVSDSKRRHVMASINTFTTSLANNLGVSGTSKEYLLSNIPALAFNLYDGCYIYSPSETKYTVKDANNVTVFMTEKLANSPSTAAVRIIGSYHYDEDDEGKILYKVKPTGSSDGIYHYKNNEGIDIDEPFTLDPKEALTSVDNASQNYPHILKPFAPYSETVTTKDDKELIINYTLDNYVTIYGDWDDDGIYTSKAGYLNITSPTDEGENIITIPDSNFNHSEDFIDGAGNLKNPVAGIKFNGQEIGPELLSETIAYKDGTDMKTATFNYVYEAEKNAKIYYDGEFFRLNSNKEKVYIKNLTEPLYKKCTIPIYDEDGNYSYIKVYQDLVTFKWYVRSSSDVYRIIDTGGDLATEWDDLLYSTYFDDICYDYSAINYCVETYEFTNWLNRLELEYTDKKLNDNGTIENTGSNKRLATIESGNDPEKKESAFYEHKREVIKNTIISNLNQAITSYSKETANEYRLPKLKETEWDQVLNNISMITFLQNIPIGLKYYNDYAIATSTSNKEFVDPTELYMYDQNGGTNAIYHSPYCQELADSTNLIGYRSIDFIYQYYKTKDPGTGEEKNYYYFRHSNELPVTEEPDPITQACYHCLVQRALYVESKTDEKTDAYYTTLARERYLQLDSIIIDKSDVKVEKTITDLAGNPINELDYGTEAIYTITITNNAPINDIINIVDWYDSSKISITDITVNKPTFPSAEPGTVDVDGTIYNCYSWTGVPIDAGDTIIIKLKAKIIGDIGEKVTNYVGIFSYFTHSIKLDSDEVDTTLCKEVEFTSNTEAGDLNIIMILDNSLSMIGHVGDVEKAAETYANVLKDYDIKGISFEQKTNDIEFKTVGTTRELQGYGFFHTRGGTNYLAAFDKANSLIVEGKNNIIVFMTDGCPTLYQNTIGNDSKYEEIVEIAKDRLGIFGWALGILGDSLRDLGLDILGAIEAIAGGWLELVWLGENDYGFTLLVGDLVAAILDTDGILNDPVGTSKHVWQNQIMKEVNEIKAKESAETKIEIYTVYFNTSNDDKPIYGLSQIATKDIEDEYWFNSKNANELEEDFEKIAEKNKGVSITTPGTTSYGEVVVENVSKITSIEIGGNTIDSSIVATIKSDMMSSHEYNSAEDKGILHINDYSAISKETGKITIIY